MSRLLIFFIDGAGLGYLLLPYFMNKKITNFDLFIGGAAAITSAALLIYS